MLGTFAFWDGQDGWGGGANIIIMFCAGALLFAFSHLLLPATGLLENMLWHAAGTQLLSLFIFNILTCFMLWDWHTFQPYYSFLLWRHFSEPSLLPKTSCILFFLFMPLFSVQRLCLPVPILPSTFSEHAFSSHVCMYVEKCPRASIWDKEEGCSYYERWEGEGTDRQTAVSFDIWAHALCPHC